MTGEKKMMETDFYFVCLMWIEASEAARMWQSRIASARILFNDYTMIEHFPFAFLFHFCHCVFEHFLVALFRFYLAKHAHYGVWMFVWLCVASISNQIKYFPLSRSVSIDFCIVCNMRAMNDILFGLSYFSSFLLQKRFRRTDQAQLTANGIVYCFCRDHVDIKCRPLDGWKLDEQPTDRHRCTSLCFWLTATSSLLQYSFVPIQLNPSCDSHTLTRVI